ncbi:MAG TPA: PAS domain-containing protein [Tepidisphaeraceae bacterium]|jgi:PAS domain S-box-containing protein|nr:PAS domain-containing protein [Tepidisphaeraceae bacterium]
MRIDPADIRRFGVVIATVGLALAICLFSPTLQQRGAFMLFLAAVAISAFYGGAKQGLFAIALSVLAGAYFVLTPANSISILNVEDMTRLIVFVLVATLLICLQVSRERAERSLRESEQRLSVALQATKMGVWDANLRRGDFWWSPSLEEIFGRAPGQFSQTYEGFYGYVHPEDRDFVSRAVTRTVDEGTDYEIEHRIVRPDGTVRWINTRGRILYGDAGATDRIVGVAQDITERKLASGHLVASEPHASQQNHQGQAIHQ